ncbi:hypothetical protein CAEBREN_14990 [Caenorhabditis brenneri]|uniref:Uncharacterized protein n=1 Tax=Caenorhabditis brenneri TaxID=135651 RepID=G0NBI4_CAEBE|nr:hypothetical protein CAEBREN_14990 [Caenorhabditis brenneri]
MRSVGEKAEKNLVVVPRTIATFQQFDGDDGLIRCYFLTQEELAEVLGSPERMNRRTTMVSLKVHVLERIGKDLRWKRFQGHYDHSRIRIEYVHDDKTFELKIGDQKNGRNRMTKGMTAHVDVQIIEKIEWKQENLRFFCQSCEEAAQYEKMMRKITEHLGDTMRTRVRTPMPDQYVEASEEDELAEELRNRERRRFLDDLTLTTELEARIWKAILADPPHRGWQNCPHDKNLS